MAFQYAISVMIYTGNDAVGRVQNPPWVNNHEEPAEHGLLHMRICLELVGLEPAIETTNTFIATHPSSCRPTLLDS
jgi:hypothetical protein